MRGKGKGKRTLIIGPPPRKQDDRRIKYKQAARGTHKYSHPESQSAAVFCLALLLLANVASAQTVTIDNAKDLRLKVTGNEKPDIALLFNASEVSSIRVQPKESNSLPGTQLTHLTNGCVSIKDSYMTTSASFERAERLTLNPSSDPNSSSPNSSSKKMLLLFAEGVRQVAFNSKTNEGPEIEVKVEEVGNIEVSKFSGRGVEETDIKKDEVQGQDNVQDNTKIKTPPRKCSCLIPQSNGEYFDACTGEFIERRPCCP